MGVRAAIAPPGRAETAGQFLLVRVNPLGQYPPFPTCFITVLLLVVLMVSLQASLSNAVRNNEEWTKTFSHNQGQEKDSGCVIPTFRKLMFLNLPENASTSASLLQLCTKAGGSCVTTLDGYYVESVICVILGFAWWFLLGPKFKKLQDEGQSSWKCKRTNWCGLNVGWTSKVVLVSLQRHIP